MIRIDQLSDLRTLQEPLHLAMGVFDGVHLGHRAVIQRVLDGAAESGGLPGVLTFEPHPVSVVAPDRAPRRLLASIDHKARVLEQAGVRVLVVIRFDEDFAAKEPEQFIRDLEESAVDLRQLAVGQDWMFGKGRRGNLGLLEKLGAEFEIQVDGVPPFLYEGERISSTLIREAIDQGQLERASHLLGRHYSVLGTVLPGRQLGRTIGFPTANLSVQNEQLPPSGVYAVKAKLSGKTYRGVGNLGYRPTVELQAGRRLLEVHLFDFSGDLYHRELEVEFGEFIRPEKKFDGLDELKAQIEVDCERARSTD